ncbi:substrate-binding periplasmic protein [Vibrio ostreicida]|uniref:substrate-binding periplasmic protein n=1 Tax=Vibrio ostreicida TaxID=526588 RepID=UPI0015C3C601|nr:transporter substrate-binding domain-containing protein [Vibrio ostreicida]
MILWIGLLAITSHVFANTLKATQAEWPPYLMQSSEGQGIAYDVVTAAFKHIGYELDFTYTPWSRALKATRFGQNDVLIAIWKNPEREEWFTFTEPYLTNNIVTVADSDLEFVYRDLTSLNQRRVALVDNYAYGDAILQNFTYTHVPSVDLNTSIRLVISKRADMFIADDFVARWHLKRLGIARTKFDFSATSISKTPLHVAISKHHPDADEIVHKLNQYFQKMEEEKIGTLLRKYQLKN